MTQVPEWLLPFQKEDVVKVIDRKSRLIGNEMGTGKTYEAIALDLMMRKADPTAGPTLIIAPLTTLESTWVEHIEELTPDDMAYIAIDPKNRRPFLDLLGASKKPDYFILHWDVLRIIQDELRQVKWFHIIADEAHRAKNRKAQQTRALKKLRAEYKTAMTGTPVMNKPQDLWSILHWLYPKVWTSYWNFYKRYLDYEIGYPHGYHIVKGPKNEDELRMKMDPYFTRRLKEEVLPDLPDKYYTRIRVDLGPKQRQAYDEMKKEMIAWLETQDGVKPLPAPVVIAQLIRLQQLSIAYADVVLDSSKDSGMSVSLTDPSAKIDALMEIIDEIVVEEGNSIVVFSQFKQAIGLIEQRLAKAELRYVRITGDDNQAERRVAIDDFQAGKAKVFIGTIGAGSEGITLTKSSTVVFIDRDWTPARNAQAEDRCHRYGQDNAVQIIDIMANHTVDDSRFALLEMKKEWIRRMID